MAEATHLLGLPLKHKPKDIKPQGAGSGLDADKVDGLHANELGGGGPHASSHETGGGDKVHFADLEHSGIDVTLHDVLTATPHISQALKDKIHDRLHALDSVSDHSGVITDTQHGSRGSGLHGDSHPRQHALDSAADHTGGITDAQHGTRGVGLHSDAHSVYGIVSCRVGASVTGTSYAVIANSDMLLNISDFPANAKARLRVTWMGNATGGINYIQLYDQFGAAVVAGSEIAQAITPYVWRIDENSTSFTLPAGLKSFQIQAKVNAGTMTISKIELQIERS